MSGSVGSAGPFAPLPLERLAPLIAVAGFKAGESGHVVAMENSDAHPPLLVARIRDAICVPGRIVLKGNRLLGECLTGDGPTASHPHMLRDRAGDWHLTARGSATGPVANRIAEPVLWLDDTGAAPPDAAPMLELTARLWAADYVRAFLGVERVRSLTAWPVPAYAPRLVEAGGVRADDVLFFDRPLLCADLLVATRAERAGQYTTPAASQLWQRVSDRLAPPAAGGAAIARRIFLARRRGADREVLADGRFEAMLAPHGFTEVDPDTLEILALARLLAGASLVAGVSGTGLATLGLARSVRGVLALTAPGCTSAAGEGLDRQRLAHRPDVALQRVDATSESAVAAFVAVHG